MRESHFIANVKTRYAQAFLSFLEPVNLAEGLSEVSHPRLVTRSSRQWSYCGHTQSVNLSFLPQVTFQKSMCEAVVTFLAVRKKSSWPFRKLICKSLFASCSEQAHCFEHLLDWLYWMHSHHYISPVSFFHSVAVDENIGIVMLNCWGAARCPWRTPELWLQVTCEGHFQLWFICRK